MSQKVIQTGTYQSGVKATIQEVHSRLSEIEVTIDMAGAYDPPAGDPPIPNAEIVELNSNIFNNISPSVKFYDGGGKTKMVVTVVFDSKKPGTGENFRNDKNNLVQ